jgi:hypothetical protein
VHFAAKTDIEAPVDFVYAVLTDFEGWERAAMRRGADVHRTDKLREPGPGMSWTIGFRFRGKERVLAVNLLSLDVGAKLTFKAEGKLIEAGQVVEVLSLAPKRTRLTLSMDIRPKTLGARLLLQSLKLAKTKVQIRLNKRMVQLATDIETRYASTRKLS